MQKTFEASGKLKIVLSYAQLPENEAWNWLRERAPTLSVYDQLNPPGALCGGGLPDAYLFDHTGRLVRHGHPAELYGLVADLVKAVPDPVPAGILGAFVPTLLIDQARALEDESRPVGPVLQELSGLVGTDDARAAEAGALVAQVRAWAMAEVERMEQVAQRRPGTSAFHARAFLTRFRGTDAALEKRAQALEKKLLTLTGVRAFVEALEDLQRAQLEPDPRRKAQFERRAEGRLRRLAEDARTPSALRQEAAERLAIPSTSDG